MYRKPAPKPFDERVLARWRGALHARRLVHVMRKYSWPWPASFALGAIVFGAIGVTFPVKTELVCEAEGCALRKTYLPWRTEVLPITSLSAHDTQLSDEEKGPKLLVQREGALPEWYARPDAFALAKRAGEARDGGEPLVAELAGAGAAAGFGAGGVACLGTALLLWALRTVLIVRFVPRGRAGRPAEPELEVRRWLQPSRAIPLRELGSLQVEDVDDSEFERLRFGPTSSPILLEASPGHIQRAKAFLEKARAEAKRAADRGERKRVEAGEG